MAMKNFDFSGWASRNNMLCSDGRTILKDAFKDCDGQTVPLVWSHIHDDPDMVLGHAVLENRNEGLYAYCSFNDSKKGQATKHLVEHGDVVSLSIFANQLKQKGSNVLHGLVREVSVVLAGANPGAFIDQDSVNQFAMEHGEPFDDEIGVIFTGEPIELYHSDDEEDKEKTIQDVLDTMTEEQKEACYALVGMALEEQEKEGESKEEDDSEEMEHADAGLKKKVKIEAEEESEIEDEDETEDEEAEESEEEEVSEDEEEEESEEEDEEETENKSGGKKVMAKTLRHADDQNDEKTLQDVIDTMNEEQKNAMYALVGMALEEKEASDEEDEGGEEMKHNVFDAQGCVQDDFLCHEDRMAILEAAKKDRRSLKDTINDFYGEDVVIAHSIDTTGMETPVGQLTYGFNDPSMLFPEYKSIDNIPQWIQRDQTWVSKVMSAVHKSPFSRLKSVFADITEAEARAKGYVTGSLKVEEVFSTLRRTTDPQTIYKKQKMDRDNIIDITDFNVVEWIKAEMRVMLNEEIARAILIGDGRSSLATDKIKEDHIRPIVSDVPLFNVKVPVANGGSYADVIKAIIRARKNYKGSGNPTFFTTEDVITEMLLLEDQIGRPLYATMNELATKLRVKEIVPVEAMEGYTIDIDGSDKNLIGVIVNLNDYNVGTDKGGEINYFDDFDIDYNQEKYLIETRMSGALVKPFSAMTIYAEGTLNP